MELAEFAAKQQRRFWKVAARSGAEAEAGVRCVMKVAGRCSFAI